MRQRAWSSPRCRRTARVRRKACAPATSSIAIGHEPVHTPEEVPQKAAAAKKGGRKNLLVRVEREGSARFVALPAEGG